MLQGLLTNKSLHKALAEVFYVGLKSPFDFQEIELADHIRRARGFTIDEVSFKYRVDGVKNRLRGVLQSLVIDKLTSPYPVTIDDLTAVAITQLAGIPLNDSDRADEVERAITRFATFAVSEIQAQRSVNDVAFSSVWMLPDSDPPTDQRYLYESGGEKHSHRVWESHSGFELWLFAVPFGPGYHCEVQASLTGRCTESAMKRAEAELMDSIVSLGRTVQLCATCQECVGEDPVSGPSFDFLTQGDGPEVMSTCLTAHCQQLTKENDPLMSRLHNATALLMHADQIGSDPIGLSLSFAAIEALVCEEGELPVNKQVKRHVSTLLTQEVEKRKSCERILGRLYDIRCQVLHGSDICASYEANQVVRRIAAGVVRNVVCWRKSQTRSGGDTYWREFMNEVNAASRNSGIMVGVRNLSDLVPDHLPK